MLMLMLLLCCIVTIYWRTYSVAADPEVILIGYFHLAALLDSEEA